MSEEVSQNSETNRERSNANLRPFQPGQSGNPGGRPKRKWLTEVTEELLREKLEDPAFRTQYKEQLWKKLLSERVVGSMTLDKVWERTEGKVAQDIHVDGELALTITDRLRRALDRKQKG